MTFQELKKEILDLGFETDVPSDSILLSAINRAVQTVAAQRGSYGYLDLSLDRPAGRKIFSSFTHHSGATDRFALAGLAYCFSVSGRGQVALEAGGNRTTAAFSGEGAVMRGFLPGSGALTFTGDCFFTVRDLTVFSDRPGEDEEDIPAPDGTRVLRMDDLVGDFLCFSSLPTDGAGRVRQDVRLEDGRIFVRGGATGTARVRYRRLPAAIDGNDPGQKIDLPRECLPLVPLLAAS